MFRFDRQKILTAFLAKQWTTNELARRAGVGFYSALKAVNGEAVSAAIASKVAAALGIDAVETLAAKRDS